MNREKDNTDLIIETEHECLKFPDKEVKSVWWGNQKVSDLSTLVEAIDRIRSSQTKTSSDIVQQDNKRTRKLVRAFGFSSVGLYALAIGLVSYLVHAENIDMMKVDAIYERLSVVESSHYITGEQVRYKASSFDKAGQNMHEVALAALAPDGVQGNLQLMNLSSESWVNCSGELLEHWQNEHGVWYAVVTFDGAYLDPSSQWVKSKKNISFVLPESRLRFANAQYNDVHKN